MTSVLLSRIVFNEKDRGILKENSDISQSYQRGTQLQSHRARIPEGKELDVIVVTPEESDNTELATGMENPQASEVEASDATPLSYEEELKQRWRNFKKTPEYKEYSRKFSELARKSNAASEPIGVAGMKWNEYMMNPYSVFGLTKAAGENRTWSEEELAFMDEEGKRIKQELDGYVNVQRALFQQMSELVQWTKDLVGMTDEEYYIAIGRPPRPPSRPTKDAGLIRQRRGAE